MRDGGDVLALGRNIQQTMQELKADLPIGIEPVMVADQPGTVSHAINEFMEALWESIAIVLVVSMVSLGLRPGAIVIISIPLVLAVVFAAMQALGIDLQRISLGALIIALGLLVDDAMITIESMVSRLERGDDKKQAAIFAYASTAYPRLTGTLVTIAGFVPRRGGGGGGSFDPLPVGFARSDAGEYTFSLFAVVALALFASWVVSGLFAPVVGLALLRPPKHPHGETLGAPMRLFRRCLLAAMRAEWITIVVTGRWREAMASAQQLKEWATDCMKQSTVSVSRITANSYRNSLKSCTSFPLVEPQTIARSAAPERPKPQLR